MRFFYKISILFVLTIGVLADEPCWDSCRRHSDCSTEKSCWKPNAHHDGCCVEARTWRENMFRWWNSNVNVVAASNSGTETEVQGPTEPVRKEEPKVEPVPLASCTNPCKQTADCSPGLSCFRATETQRGCCLKALKPNQSGCVIDEQCTRACVSSYCDQASLKCRCDKGSHYLFNKCWHKCPAFAHEQPEVDADGISVCVVKGRQYDAVREMSRMKRQTFLGQQSARIFC